MKHLMAFFLVIAACADCRAGGEGTTPVPYSASSVAVSSEVVQPAALDEDSPLFPLLAELRKLDQITGSAVGYGGAPGRFYLLSRNFLDKAKGPDFEQLAEDREPIVRAMGLLGLAQQSDERATRRIIAHLHDRARLAYFPGGCMGSTVPLGVFARELLADS